MLLTLRTLDIYLIDHEQRLPQSSTKGDILLYGQ